MERIGGARIDWSLEGDMGERLAKPWVRGAARAVAAYLGEFPDDVRLRLVAEPGRGVRFGTARHGDPPRVRVWLGDATGPSDFADDWVLVHELLHVGFPGLPESAAWLTEGMATYAEPLARAAGGLRDERGAWQALHNSLPQGETPRGAGGLEGSESWARRYWGGALWCFAADVHVREATAGTVSLAEAQRRLAASGGTLRRFWSSRTAVRALDRLSETTVFSALHEAHAHAARRFDVDALWRRARKLGMVPRS